MTHILPVYLKYLHIVCLLNKSNEAAELEPKCSSLDLSKKAGCHGDDNPDDVAGVGV